MPAECARSKLESHMAKRLLQRQSLRTGAASSAGVFASTHAHVDLHLDLETVGVINYTSTRLCAHMFFGSFSISAFLFGQSSSQRVLLQEPPTQTFR